MSAAHRLDFDRLGALADRPGFTYSLDETGNPEAYWRRLEGEGEVPVIGDFLPVTLGLPFARKGHVYAWPSVSVLKPSEWTRRDVAALELVHSAAEIRRFRATGRYTGWRTGIRDDGTWLYFLSG